MRSIFIELLNKIKPYFFGGSYDKKSCESINNTQIC